MILNSTLTTNEFIEKAVKLHGNKYDYSLVNYKNNSINVKIICRIHGVFKQRPGNHLNGPGCSKCSYAKITGNIEDFVKKAKQIHKDKYNYSKVVYVNNRTPILITCSIHGDFPQKPTSHLKHGCFKCGGTNKSNTKEFIEKAEKVHNKKYNYDLVIYKNNRSKVEIICSRHGIFKQSPNSHLSGNGCLKCNSSKGEAVIRKYLEEKKVNYKEQIGFDTCKNKKKLLFDFVINYKDKIYIIEYYGEQHYSLVNFSNNKEKAIKKFDYNKKSYWISSSFFCYKT